LPIAIVWQLPKRHGRCELPLALAGGAKLTAAAAEAEAEPPAAE